MKNIFLLVLLLFTACSRSEALPVRADQEVSAETQRCEKDSECIYLSNCGPVINKKFENKIKPYPECYFSPSNPIPVCENNKCALKVGK